MMEIKFWQWHPGLAHGGQHEGELLEVEALQIVFGPEEDSYNEIFWHEVNSEADEEVVEID
jgi:hypothetical protein